MAGSIIAIIGPTATGKTAVGMELAKQFSGEIISADSMAIYRGMDIGTAKPTNWEQKEVRFHLIDIIDPDMPYSVALFKRDARRVIDDIISRGKLPIVVGGTGLYIKALAGGFNIPKAPPNYELRERLRKAASSEGNERLLKKLARVDPKTADRLHPNDLNRIIRALEVYITTGKPISYYHDVNGSENPEYDIQLFGLTMERGLLYKRIEDRIDAQIRAGLVQEVRSLLDRGYDRNLASMKGLGYKQIAAYISGECDYDEAIQLFKRDTRHFAKRQVTWFKAVPNVMWTDMTHLDLHDAVKMISTAVSHVGNNRNREV